MLKPGVLILDTASALPLGITPVISTNSTKDKVASCARPSAPTAKFGTKGSKTSLNFVPSFSISE